LKQRGLGHIDVCVTDFDRCMCPGISKVAVARDIALALAATPKRGSGRCHSPKVGVAAGLLVTLRLWQRLVAPITDGDLVSFYATPGCWESRYQLGRTGLGKELAKFFL
jgi:hypothetical protein